MSRNVFTQVSSWMGKGLGSRKVRDLFRFSGRDKGSYQIVRPGKVSSELPVPEHIRKPSYYFQYEPPTSSEGTPEIKGTTRTNGVRESCRIAANVLQKCAGVVQIGMTTDEIDQFVHFETISADAYPSPLRYAAFPKSVCTSVNNVVCHGIPDDRPLADGDIINVDVTVYYKGFHGDCSRTFLIGNVDDKGRHLVDITEECLYKAIRVCGPGVPFNRIGACIDEHAEKHGLRVVPEFVGHGIGSYFHGPPAILHYENDYPGEMAPGMVFTIEPILTLGSPSFKILADEWTAVTTDNSRSAQFEHTILITDKGCEVLTIADSD